MRKAARITLRVFLTDCIKPFIDLSCFLFLGCVVPLTLLFIAGYLGSYFLPEYVCKKDPNPDICLTLVGVTIILIPPGGISILFVVGKLVWWGIEDFVSHVRRDLKKVYG